MSVGSVTVSERHQDVQPRDAEAGRRSRGHRPHRGVGGVRLADRAVRLWQVDVAAADRQPHRADSGRSSSTASRPARPASTRTTGWRSSRPACSTGGPSSATSSCRSSSRVGIEARRRAPGDGDARARQARRVRRSPTVAAVRWNAAAGGDRPGAGRRAAAVADGRAVRRPRRDDPRAHAGRAAADQRRGGHERRVRHPLDSRGRVPRRPGRRDVAAARADHRGRRRRARRPPQHRHP